MKYFSKKEFACSCGCGFSEPAEMLLDRLTAARVIARIPFIITSGCRCISKNHEVGGAENSAHLLGEAADIWAHNSNSKYTIVRAMIMAGFERIGIGGDFIHADVSSSNPQQVVWTY